MELWLFGLFFARRNNRPEPCVCFEERLSRPFVELFWNCAVRRYMIRNPDEVRPRCI